MSIPYKETVLGNNQYLRTFSEDVDDHELEWHKDREDRIVEVIENHGWEFQMDNELPVYLENTLFISKETYHRVIKGNGQLIVKITKLI
jgi:hypothetical protein